MMVRALEAHDRLGPELPHDGDLLADAAAAGVEVLVQRLVLDMIPANTHAEPQATAGEDVHRSGLLGHQRGLALGQYDDTGDELEALRAGSQITEQNEYLVEGALVGVGRPAAELVEALELATEHVVEDEQVIVAGTLRGLGVVADHRRVRADLRLGKYHAESHIVSFLRAHLSSSVIAISSSWRWSMPGWWAEWWAWSRARRLRRSCDRALSWTPTAGVLRYCAVRDPIREGGYACSVSRFSPSWFWASWRPRPPSTLSEL